MMWIGWESIFECSGGDESSVLPSKDLGVDYVEASKESVQMAVGLHGESVVLEVYQDIKLGIGGVVWDCVRERCLIFITWR